MSISIDDLKVNICAHLRVLAPDIEDSIFIVEECIANARNSFKDEFIIMLSPHAWAKITLIYYKHFLDSKQDFSIAEIIIAVLRDSITTNRMDMVTLALSQQKLDEPTNRKKLPKLEIVKE